MSMTYSCHDLRTRIITLRFYRPTKLLTWNTNIWVTWFCLWESVPFFSKHPRNRMFCFQSARKWIIQEQTSNHKHQTANVWRTFPQARHLKLNKQSCRNYPMHYCCLFSWYSDEIFSYNMMIFMAIWNKYLNLIQTRLLHCNKNQWIK